MFKRIKINNRFLPFLAVVCGFFYASGLSAQTDTVPAVSTSANVDLVSRYVWRGLDIGHAPAIQPALSVTWKGFTLGSWGSYKLTGAGEQETDFYLSKSFSFVTVAIWDYWNFCDTTATDFFNYRNNSTAHLLEAQVLFSGGEKMPFNLLASYFFYGSDPSRSIYLELQYVHKSDFADLMVFAGYQAKGTYYASGSGFVNIGCTAKKSINITDRFALPLSLSLVVNPSVKSTVLVAGITF
jgi:hypothetical protein